jgi:hypothetical protein
MDRLTESGRRVTSAEELFRYVYGDSRGLLCISSLGQDTKKMQEQFFNYPDAAATAAEFALE